MKKTAKEYVTDLNTSAKQRDYISNKNSVVCVELHDISYTN